MVDDFAHSVEKTVFFKSCKSVDAAHVLVSKAKGGLCPAAGVATNGKCHGSCLSCVFSGGFSWRGGQVVVE
jgi:hypothetical protein